MKAQSVTREHSAGQFWDLYSHYYDSVYHLMPYRKLLWDSYDALDLKPGMRVLDAGCGTGNFEAFIAQKNPPAIQIQAVDFSQSMLARARAKCTGLDSADFVWADLDKRLPFPDNSFDRIVSINVLYTLPDRDHTMRELMRVLRPGGRMVLTSPAPGYRWGPLVVDHFGRIRNIWGSRRRVLRALSSVWMLCTSALGAFLLNVFVIYRREKAGQYHAMDETEFRGFLSAHREDGLEDFEIVPTFAEQNLFATAMKTAYAS